MAIYLFSPFSFDDKRGSLVSRPLAMNPDNNSGDLSHDPDMDSPSNEVHLRHKVANLLAYLIENRDRIISKEELLDKLWQHGDYRENSLTQSIRELRAALGDNAKSPRFIKTFPQRGYQWMPSVALADSELDSQVSDNNNANKEGGSSPENTLQDVAQSSIKPSNDVLQSPSEMHADESPIKRFRRYHVGFFLALLMIVFAVVFNHYISEQNTDAPTTSSNMQVDSLLVLPFINATEKPSMAWLELGLADMLAVDLQRHDAMANNQLLVTPPAIANALLVNAQLQWPALPVHIRSLLREHDIGAAIFASVRLHKEQQVLDFQIIHANGKTQEGSISYPSLPASLQSISQQLLHLLNPQKNRPKQHLEDDPIAAQALAQGMQALQKEGPIRARKYFQATLLIEEENYWARAYSARSSIALGQWLMAETDFNHIPPNVLMSDPSLDAFVHYWRAEIAFRRGDEQLDDIVTLALNKAEAASDAKQMARGYRLKAQIAWHKNDWPAHKRWSTKAQQLFAINNELNIEAEQLFYLGNPSNIGLEKSPDNNLTENQGSLLKALNFYQQLDNKTMVAASHFAIAKNYTFELKRRASALKVTLAMYEALEQPYELAQALNYAGFFHMQLHEGVKASEYFLQAKAIAQSLGAKPLVEMSDFYLAFAILDQGLDQSSLGRHGTNEDKLRQAIVYLQRFIANEPSLDLQGSALVFLGWANTELGLLDLALDQLNQAKQLNGQLGMEMTQAYSSYSMMRIYLQQGNYQAITAMAHEKIVTRFQAIYLARAYYELDQVTQAITILTNFKVNHKSLWQPQDDTRLTQYKSSQSGPKLILSDEPKAHLVYCESDWVL